MRKADRVIGRVGISHLIEKNLRRIYSLCSSVIISHISAKLHLQSRSIPSHCLIYQNPCTAFGRKVYKTRLWAVTMDGQNPTAKPCTGSWASPPALMHSPVRLQWARVRWNPRAGLNQVVQRFIEGIQGMLMKIKSRKYRWALQLLESHQASGFSGCTVSCLPHPRPLPCSLCVTTSSLPAGPTAPSFALVHGICFLYGPHYTSFKL